jgi:hypothetical protein
MERRAVCQVSNRWLQFPDAASSVEDHTFLCVEVMTHNSDEREKKICQLVLTKEDLLQILERIQVKKVA